MAKHFASCVSSLLFEYFNFTRFKFKFTKENFEIVGQVRLLLYQTHCLVILISILDHVSSSSTVLNTYSNLVNNEAE